MLSDAREAPSPVPYGDLLRCPGCGGELALRGDSLDCPACAHRFPIDDGIPMLFWPNHWQSEKPDVTEIVKAFYEETPFPNYDEFDSMESLARKAREGVFARMLDEQLPPGIRIAECGCGTAQLSNFLSRANREIFATDICVNSLRMGKKFADEQGASRVHFVQQNLFRPVFRPGSFHLVVSNGVLHHTSDPRRAFESIARLVAPGGYILVGLYHRYGRLACDARRLLYRLTGERFKGLDQEVARDDAGEARREAWFNDQYRHPHESKHTIRETMGWLEGIGFSFVTSIPSPRLFAPIGPDFQLFEPTRPASGLELALAEIMQTFSGGRDNGFFVVLGRRPV
jgi:SAM-dependent methyltransferase